MKTNISTQISNKRCRDDNIRRLWEGLHPTDGNEIDQSFSNKVTTEGCFLFNAIQNHLKWKNNTIPARHPKMFKNGTYNFHPHDELVMSMPFKLMDSHWQNMVAKVVKTFKACTINHHQADQVNRAFWKRWFLQPINWHKPFIKVPYKCTIGTPNQGQMLDVWESQTAESALRWQMHYDVPCHNLELTLEIILEHMLRIMTMTKVFNPGSHSNSLSVPKNQYRRETHDLIPKS